ncbi:MAG TPA: CBS domain-containing protein [Verrucomicrobiae bacterium]|nr:CBS domain-containing protein [Verrucomicrobiae bacterium]
MESDWRLSQTFLENHPYEAGLVLETFAPARIAELLCEVPAPIGVAVLERMSSSTSAACLLEFPGDHAATLIETLSLDTATRLLRCLATDERARLLSVVSEQRSLPLQRLLTYPPGTAGSLMDPQVLALPEALAVGDALERVQRSPQHSLYYLYVIDAEQKLAGVINLRELMLASSQERLATVMHTPVEKLSAGAVFPEILLHPAWREFHALPVTGDGGKFLGAVRYKTLKRLEQENSRQEPANETMTALLSLGELCWIGFAGMLAGLAASVFPGAIASNKGTESSHDAID